jgi:hypothetical protein
LEIMSDMGVYTTDLRSAVGMIYLTGVGFWDYSEVCGR